MPSSRSSRSSRSTPAGSSASCPRGRSVKPIVSCWPAFSSQTWPFPSPPSRSSPSAELCSAVRASPTAPHSFSAPHLPRPFFRLSTRSRSSLSSRSQASSCSRPGAPRHGPPPYVSPPPLRPGRMAFYLSRLWLTTAPCGYKSSAPIRAHVPSRQSSPTEYPAREPPPPRPTSPAPRRLRRWPPGAQAVCLGHSGAELASAWPVLLLSSRCNAPSCLRRMRRGNWQATGASAPAPKAP
mmetsp:Transcript_19843/g.64461  ORF Transcript_19843/g.64461 Transcript_19843/m.64461 type:complete len:238 (-) Transcript_19843:257-970(-)